MREGLQCFWLSALAGVCNRDENASSKISHGAYRFPLCKNKLWINRLEKFNQILNINDNKLYLRLSIIFFVVWLTSVSPLRDAYYTDSKLLIIFFGSAPNLFAGITFIFWQTYIVSTKIFNAFLYSFGILIIGEFIQLFMNNQTADLWDILASFFGCLVGALIVLLIEKKLMPTTAISNCLYSHTS